MTLLVSAKPLSEDETLESILKRSTRSIGATRSLACSFDNDNKSPIKRAIRSASFDIIPKNRSLATLSFAAAPCSVSTKPDSAVKGERSS